MTGFANTWIGSRIRWDTLLALTLALTTGLAIAVLPLTWTAVLLAGAITLVLTLARPQFGVLLLIPAIPFGSLRQVSLGGLNAGLAELLLGLVLVAWLARMVGRRAVRFAPHALTPPLLLLLGAMLLSLPQAHSLQHSAKELLKWLEVLALMVLVAQETEERWARLFVCAFLGTGALAALHGIYQFLFQVGPEAFVLFGRFMRAYGTFEQPNPFGGYLGLTLPLAIGLLLGRLGHGAWHRRVDPVAGLGWRWTVWAITCGGLMAAALLMSWSRGAWLGFAAATAAMVLAVLARSGRMAALVLVAAILLAYGLLAGGWTLAPPALLQRLTNFVPFLGPVDILGVEVTDANYAVVERMAHWQAAVAMWTDHPWLGVGIGNYEPAYSQYALPRWPLPLGHAHNYFLNIAAETGLVGLVSYLGFCAAALLAAWRAIGRAVGGASRSAAPQGVWNWGLALGTLGVIVHLMVHNLVDNLYVHSMYLQVAILLGLMSAQARASTQAPLQGEAVRPAPLCARHSQETGSTGSCENDDAS